MRHRLDFTIHELPVYACNERFWGRTEDSGGLIWYVVPHSDRNDRYLDQNGEWQESGTFDPMPGFATREEAVDFAEQFRDGRITHQCGTKMPFQILGRDVWICSGRLALPGVVGGISGDYYIADVPEGRNGNMLTGDGNLGVTPLWRTLDLQAMGGSFVSFNTAKEAMDRACKLAGVDPVYPNENSGPPVLNLELLLGKTLNALIRLPAPPPDIRGLVLAKTSLWVPEDVTDIAGWLTENWKPGAKTVAAAKPKTSYSLNVGYSQREYGSASFSRTAEYSGEIEYTSEELADLFDGSTDLDEMEQRLRDDIEENADLDQQDTSDTEYSDEEIQDTGDRDWSIPTRSLRSVIEQFLEANPEMHPDYEEPEEEEEDDYEEDAEEVPEDFEESIMDEGEEQESPNEIPY